MQTTSSTETAPKRLSVETLPPEVMERLRGPCGLNDAQVRRMVDAVNRGVRSVGEYVGMTPAAANGVESLALAYYRHERFDLAFHLYSFLVQLFPERISAWRGLGAVGQAQREYVGAITAYLMALTIDPGDVASQALLGEAYLLSGRREHGIGALQLALSLKPRQPHDPDYLKRAQVLLDAQLRRGQAAAAAAAPTATNKAQAAPAAADALGSPAPEPGSEEEMEAFVAERMGIVGHIEGAEDAVRLLATPEMRAVVEKIEEGVNNGSLTRKQVAGISDAQMQSAYVAASLYLEQGKPMDAFKLVGWLHYLDANNSTYQTLGGLTAHHLKLYCLADYYYACARIHGDKSARLDLYHGEIKLLTDEREVGLQMLRRGIELGAKQQELQELIKRGKFLIKQFSAAAAPAAKQGK